MNKSWKQIGGHPGVDLLLLHLEGELEPKHSDDITEHLKHCWGCRAHSERMQLTICAFVEFRDTRVLPNLPQPPAAGLPFFARLYRIAAQQDADPFRTLLLVSYARRASWAIRNACAQHRPRLFTAAVALAMALVLALLPIFNPPSVSAAEFVEHVRSSRKNSRPGAPNSGIYQRVEIRHAGRSVIRELFFGLPQPMGLALAPASEVEDLFRASGCDWNDPLSVQSFSLWRGGLAAKRETIRTAGGRITLTTHGESGSPVTAASITVRSADWHPEAERLELRGSGGTIEVQELAYEIRKIDLPPASGSASANHTPHIVPPVAPAPEAAKIPSSDDLEIAEARLREAFHEIGADVREAPQIWRDRDRVFFHFLAESPERQATVLRYAGAIPQVEESLEARPAVASAIPPARGPLRTFDPPLADLLEQSMGSVDLAMQFLDRAHDSYLSLIAEASALDRLGARYPASRFAALPIEARERIGRIAEQQIADVRREGAGYLALVSPVLDLMLQKTGTATEVEAAPGTCGTWQEEAARLSLRIRQFQGPFSRLFVRQSVEEDFSPATEELLRQAARHRVEIRATIQGSCLHP